MKEAIKKQYNNMLNNADFSAFVEDMEKYSTDEIIALYGAKNDIISYCSGLSEMPTSTPVDVENLHLMT